MKSFLTLLVIALATKSIQGAPVNDRHGRLTTRANPLSKLNEKCGSKNGSCESGLCCSQWGYCGTSSDHCSGGCQKQYGTCGNGLKKLNEQCGSKYGTCDTGLCCSEWGYCGYSSDHCTGKCQSKYGTCGIKTTTSASTSKSTSSTKSSPSSSTQISSTSSTTAATSSSSTFTSQLSQTSTITTSSSSSSSTTTSSSQTSSTTTDTSSSSTATSSAQTSSTTADTNSSSATTSASSQTSSSTAGTNSSSTATSSSSQTSSATTTSTQPTSTPSVLKYLDEQCGTKLGSCAPGLCCGPSGFCGYTSGHCSTGCQKDFGICDNKIAAEVITGCTAPGTFAVTYDDGPSVLTSGLLDYLDEVNVKATFFINGNNRKNGDTGNPMLTIYELADVVRRAYNSGHQICSHTWAHTDIITVSEQEVVYEMTRLNYAFSKVLGKVPTCMRPPYGDTDGPSLKILHKMGYTVVNWDMDPVDWNPENSIDEMYQEYVDQTGTTDPQVGRFISLNHDVWNTTADFRPESYPRTIPLAKRSIDYLLGRGWKLVNLADCLQSPPFYREANPSDSKCGTKACV